MEYLKHVSRPTVDRPFGVHLWPLFDAAWTKAVGYPAEDFRFVQGVTPFSTVKEAIAAIVTYYIIIFGGREVMRKFEPVKLKFIFQIHNFFLTLLSGTLLVLFVEELFPILIRNGLYHGICHRDGGWTKKLVVLYYLNYLTKYVELLDTVFLFLKKKPLTFLHCYHHGATAFLCYTQLIGSTAVSWVPITLNLGVHVVMYWYYFQTARGVQVWWKQWITRLQIIQFVLDLGFVYFASYNYFTSTYFADFPHTGECSGEEFAAFAGMGILSSYLFLFLSFYAATYKRKGRRAARKSISNGTIAIDPKFTDDMVASVNNNAAAVKASGRANGSVRSRKA